jgi:hypothetical protein
MRATESATGVRSRSGAGVSTGPQSTMDSNADLRSWIQMARQQYERLPAAAEGVLKRVYPYVLPLTRFCIPISILRGPTRMDGHPGTVIVAGAEPWVDYLTDRFFEGPPKREPVGKVQISALPRALRELRGSADLTIARLDRISASLFFDEDYLRAPEWVGMSLVVPDDPAKLVKRSGSLKEDFRVVRRNRLTSDITRGEEDFLAFYHTMYVPLIRKRHGKQAVVRSVSSMRRWFRQGGLLRIWRNGQPIAGAIFLQRNQLFYFVTLGTANGQWEHVKAGAIAALYFFCIKLAREIGCKQIDFGGCRPSLTDGVLRYKRKWGVSLREKRDTYYDFLVHWNRLDGPVTSFLSRAPLIFRDRGGLSGLMAIDNEQSATGVQAQLVYRSMWIPGLDRLYIASKSGWQPNDGTPPQTHLIDVSACENSNPRTLLITRERPARANSQISFTEKSAI